MDGGMPADTELRQLAATIQSCTDCQLHQARKLAVPGEGPADSAVMFIGEGPGYHEDKQGEPFVGAAGQLLNRMLAEIDMQREDVYIGNVVKCRPPGNRDPYPDEIEACTPWLTEQIEAIDPVVIVTLGNFATRFILNKQVSISRVRGQRFPWNGRTVIPTFHPAAILRGGGENSAQMIALRTDFQEIRLALAERRVAALGAHLVAHALERLHAAEHVEQPAVPAVRVRRAAREVDDRHLVDVRGRQVVHADRVVRVRDRAQERDEEPDLRPAVEPRVARERPGDPAEVERAQELVGVVVRAHEDGHVVGPPRALVRPLADHLRDRVRLLRRGLVVEVHRRAALALLHGREVLADPGLHLEPVGVVVHDQPVGRVEQPLVRAVVLGEDHLARGGIQLEEAEHVRDRRAAPPIPPRPSFLRERTVHLPARDREVLILRIGRLCGAAYEWAQHVPWAERAGLTADEIHGIAAGADAAVWSDAHDCALLRAGDQLHRATMLDDATWTALAARYGTAQLMDVVFTVGQYRLVSAALNTLGVRLDAYLRAYPSP